MQVRPTKTPPPASGTEAFDEPSSGGHLGDPLFSELDSTEPRHIRARIWSLPVKMWTIMALIWLNPAQIWPNPVHMRLGACYGSTLHWGHHHEVDEKARDNGPEVRRRVAGNSGRNRAHRAQIRTRTRATGTLPCGGTGFAVLSGCGLLARPAGRTSRDREIRLRRIGQCRLHALWSESELCDGGYGPRSSGEQAALWASDAAPTRS